MKPRTLSPILSNAGVAAAYRDKLKELINNLFSAYAGNLLSQIVGMSASGALPVARDARRKSVAEAEADFEKKAAALAESFVKSAETSCNAGIIKALKKAGFSQSDIRKLRKNPGAFEGLRQQIISENVKLITKIPAATKKRIEGMVARSIEKDRDLGGLVDELKTVKNMTLRRAEIISRDQNNKVTEQFSLLRCQSLGITEGIWMHRGGAKKPRPEHVEFNGQKFNLSEGLFDENEGRFVLPGELIGCRCSYKPVLPDVLTGGIEAPESADNPPPVEPEQPETESEKPDDDNLLNWRDKYERDPKVIKLRETERKQDDIIREALKDYQPLMKDFGKYEFEYTVDKIDRTIHWLSTNPEGDIAARYAKEIKEQYGVDGLKEIKRMREQIRIAENAQAEKSKARIALSKVIGSVEADPLYVAEHKIAARWDGGKLSTEALAELHIGIRRAQEQFPELGVMPFTGSIQARQRALKNERGRTERTKGNALAYSAGGKGSRFWAPYTGVFVNEAWFTPSKMPEVMEALADNVIKKFHPVGCDTVKSIIDHEMAHEIDRLVDAKNDGVIKRLFDSYKKRGKMEGALSGYAAKDEGEMIAEAYAECENNPRPRPLARAIVKRLKVLYSRKYGGR